MQGGEGRSVSANAVPPLWPGAEADSAMTSGHWVLVAIAGA